MLSTCNACWSLTLYPIYFVTFSVSPFCPSIFHLAQCFSSTLVDISLKLVFRWRENQRIFANYEKEEAGVKWVNERTSLAVNQQINTYKLESEQQRARERRKSEKKRGWAKLSMCQRVPAAHINSFETNMMSSAQNKIRL